MLSRDATAYLGLTVATLGWASAFIAGKFVHGGDDPAGRLGMALCASPP